MKKTLVAVAAVVAATGAIAGNSVTLYGVADVWVGSLKSPGAGSSQLLINDGGASASRIGIRVKEDLGGGMYAAVKMEERVRMDSGTRSGGPRPNGRVEGAREHWLGLGGDFGEIRLGFNNNSASDAVGFADEVSGTAFSAIDGGQFGVASTATSSRLRNSIRYVSPDFDGFYGSFTYATGENKGQPNTNVTPPYVRTKTDNAFGGMIGYEGGPLGVSVGYDVVNIDGEPDPSAVNVGAYYDFGQFKVSGGFGVSDPERGPKTNWYGIGAGFTVDNIYVAATLGSSKTKDSDNRFNSFGLEGHYNLSKRTLAYAGIARGKPTNVSAGRLFAVGIRHKF